jgi:hypothetical protein
MNEELPIPPPPLFGSYESQDTRRLDGLQEQVLDLGLGVSVTLVLFGLIGGCLFYALFRQRARTDALQKDLEVTRNNLKETNKLAKDLVDFIRTLAKKQETALAKHEALTQSVYPWKEGQGFEFGLSPNMDSVTLRLIDGGKEIFKAEIGSDTALRYGELFLELGEIARKRHEHYEELRAQLEDESGGEGVPGSGGLSGPAHQGAGGGAGGVGDPLRDSQDLDPAAPPERT